jgi:hypothetical protein
VHGGHFLTINRLVNGKAGFIKITGVQIAKQ